jgi:hypothetical protein
VHHSKIGRRWQRWVKGGGADDARTQSAYPPGLGVNTDMPARQPCATSGCEQMQQAAPLFDDLVGARQQRRWYVEAERFRGLEVDGEFVLVRGLHGQIGRFLTF